MCKTCFASWVLLSRLCGVCQTHCAWRCACFNKNVFLYIKKERGNPLKKAATLHEKVGLASVVHHECLVHIECKVYFLEIRDWYLFAAIVD